MKKIEAYIRHEAFEPIRPELLDKGFPSLSVSEVKGSGPRKRLVDTGAVVETIVSQGRSGEIGDGKIFVLLVEEAIRMRTGEEGEAALQAHTADEITAGTAAEE